MYKTIGIENVKIFTPKITVITVMRSHFENSKILH